MTCKLRTRNRLDVLCRHLQEEISVLVNSTGNPFCCIGQTGTKPYGWIPWNLTLGPPQVTPGSIMAWFSNRAGHPDESNLARRSQENHKSRHRSSGQRTLGTKERRPRATVGPARVMGTASTHSSVPPTSFYWQHITCSAHHK